MNLISIGLGQSLKASTKDEAILDGATGQQNVPPSAEIKKEEGRVIDYCLFLQLSENCHGIQP